MALLEVTSLTKTFGQFRALDGIDFAVRAGTFHGLIGPNGSGKSTLLKTIAGAHAPTSGTIRFDGADMTAALPFERARAGLSLKFQITSVFPELSTYDNVLLALQSRDGLPSLLGSRTRRTLDGEAMAALDRFRLADRANDLAGELSHGQQQWLEISLALTSRPKLLLLDEPTAGMSPEERRVTGELLRPIRSHCTLVIVEHDIDFIKNLCDHLTVLDQGRVLDEGSVEQIERSIKVREVYTSRV
jgi:ABC-type branched-subunit amino acid transport system ATPase component